MSARSVVGLALALATVASLTLASAASLQVAPQGLVAFSRIEEVPPLTCTTTATSDTFTEEAFPGNVNGSSVELRVASRSGAAKRTFVRFDPLCGIPAEAVVQSATLSLYMWSAPSQDRTYDVRRITSAWTEAATTWGTSPSEATSVTATARTGTTATTLQWDVTADVQAHVATPGSHHGWSVRDSDEAGGTTREARFLSREYGTPSLRPTLVVRYYR